MATPNTTHTVEQLSKEFFKRSAGVSIRMGVCVSCRQPAKKKDFTSADCVDQFEEYKQDGLCFRCNGFLYSNAA